MIYAYIRVSTDEQSGSSQKYELKKWSAQNKLKIGDWIEEVISGTVPPENRKLGALLASMKEGDILLCTELSRLGRSILMIMSILNECAQKGVVIHSIKDNFNLENNINSKIIAFAFALAAEIERTLISQRTKEALADKKAAGIVLGRPPGSSKKKDLVFKRKDEVIKKISDGRSISSIAKEMGIHRDTLRKYIHEFND